jgi:hypothetical protein
VTALNALRNRFSRSSPSAPELAHDAFAGASADGDALPFAEADLATIQKVRGYERKFANRSEVLEEVLRVHRRRQATQPASAAPRYQPTSARTRSGSPSVARRGADRP